MKKLSFHALDDICEREYDVRSTNAGYVFVFMLVFVSEHGLTHVE